MSTLPEHIELAPGNPIEPGAVIYREGVNFSVFSRHATQLFLCLYENFNDSTPRFQLALDPKKNKTGDIWHCFIPGLTEGTLYLWRADGPFKPEEGHRFNKHRALVDPYAKALTDGTWDLGSALAYDPADPALDLSFSTVQDDSHFPKCVVVNDAFDWQGDAPLNYPLKDCIIYETHLRGLTRGHNSKVQHPGTYRGVVEMIDYFKDLGITSIEFLPIHEFDSLERFRRNPITGALLKNYWGYSPLAFFAPKASYAYVDGEPHPPEDPSRPVREFKYMVRELHKAGIEVILDVVFNHTAEGNELGPTLSFRGLDNSIYYMLDTNKRYYKNYSGCGNTLNCNHPVMRTLIRESLRYWVVHMHVDGFRFDLGSILGRDASGRLLENPPVIESIAEDPLLRDTKIIAEAWDAGGAYQVGAFPGGRWAEWNDKFRDDVRKFWRGEPFSAMHLATRITGSSDLYLRDGRKPFHSINFITAHDGFTLHDLVSYEKKHNEENGENNLDGIDFNFSRNHGAEGPTSDRGILALRSRQMRNFLSTLFLSIGTPMLLGGDEIGRTQRGNNNAYCQDNEISWYDWSLLEKNRDLFQFTRSLIRFRKNHPVFRRPEFYTGEDSDENEMPDITWFDEHGHTPDWTKINQTLAARIDGTEADKFSRCDDSDFYLMFNGSSESCAFIIPPHPAQIPWRLVIDTAIPGQGGYHFDPPYQELAYQKSYALAPSSMVVLMACRRGSSKPCQPCPETL